MSSSTAAALPAAHGGLLFPRTTALRIAHYFEKVKNTAAEQSIKTAANRNKGKDNAEGDDEEVKQLLLLIGHHATSSKSAVELVTRFAEGAAPAPVAEESNAQVSSTVVLDAFSCVAVDVLEEQIDSLAATLPGGLTVVGIACMDGIPSLQNLLPGVKTIKQEVQEVLQAMKSHQASKPVNAQVDLSRLLWVSVASHRAIEEDAQAGESKESAGKEETAAAGDLLGLFGRNVFIPKCGASFLVEADVPTKEQEEEKGEEAAEAEQKTEEKQNEEEGEEKAQKEEEEEKAKEIKNETQDVVEESTWELDITAELLLQPQVSTSTNEASAKGDKKKSKKKNSVTGESVEAESVAASQKAVSVLVSELSEAEIFCRVDVVLNPSFLSAPLLVFAPSSVAKGSMDRKTDYTIPMQQHVGEPKGDSLLSLHKVLGSQMGGKTSGSVLSPAALALQLGVTVPADSDEVSAAPDAIRFTFLLPLFFVTAKEFSALVRTSLVHRTAHLSSIRETFAKQLDSVEGASLSTSQYASPLRYTKEDEESSRVLFFVTHVAQAHSKTGSPTKAEKKLNAKLIESAWEAYESKVIDGCDLEDEEDVDARKAEVAGPLPPLREAFLPLHSVPSVAPAPASGKTPSAAPKSSAKNEPSPFTTTTTTTAAAAAVEGAAPKAATKGKEDTPAATETEKGKESEKATVKAPPKKKSFSSSRAYWVILVSGYVVGFGFIAHVIMGARERNRLFDEMNGL